MKGAGCGSAGANHRLCDGQCRHHLLRQFSGQVLPQRKRTVATETILNYLRFCADAFLLFQVTYLLASPETIAREFRVCDTIRDNFPKYVVSLDEFDMSRDGIKHLNIREFLLKPEWN